MAECKIGDSDDRKLKHQYLLIADNDLNDLLYTSMLLQRFDYNICTTTKGGDAFEMATTVLPGLVISGLDLPDMPGLQLIKRLKRDPRTTEVPVIVKSSRITPELERECREGIGAEILQSPFQAEELYRTVQRIVETTPRRMVRIRTRLPLILNGNQLDCARGECVSELSEHGMYVRTLQPCPAASRVPVRFVLQDRQIAVDAEVLYCHNFGEGPFKQPGMGLKFVAIEQRDREFLRAYIRGEIMKGIPGR